MFAPSLSLLFAATAPLATLARPSQSARPQNFASRSTSNPKNVIANLFQWNWESVADECPWLSQAGYGFVQVSPPNEHIQGDQWWTDYQAVSYKFSSKRGDVDGFKNMINACNAVGVGVIVDILWNHMAGLDGSNTGVAGSQFEHYKYGDLYSEDDFHYCGTPGNDIQNFNDEWQVHNCELANLGDLKTESEKVRNTLATYTNSMIDMGVSGFRIDASKHVPPSDQQAIMSKLSKQGLYFTHEVVYEGGEGVRSDQYTGLGDVQEFRYTTLMKQAFQDDGIAQLTDIASRGFLPSDKANVFVVNHDRQRKGTYLTYKSPNNQFVLANVFTLAYGFGTPTVFSGYAFDTPEQGAPNGNTGSCSGDSGTNGWLCEHRWTPIANMVGFANQVGYSASVQNWKTGSNNQIAFARGNAGFVVINNDDGSWKATFTAGLPDGDYCDVISGLKTDTGCSGRTVTISGGQLQTLSIPGHSALAIHIGQKL